MIKIYTDGGSMQQGTEGRASFGSLFLKYDNDVVTYWRALGKPIRGTNQFAELTAIAVALEEIKNADSEVLIISDSQYGIKGASEWVHGWKQKGWRTFDGSPVSNRPLWERIDNARNKLPKVKWKHVRGHNGEPGNELADFICKICMRSQVEIDIRGKSSALRDVYSEIVKLHPVYCHERVPGFYERGKQVGQGS